MPQRLFYLHLRDLNGIGKQMEARLNRHKIFTIEQLYAANRNQLQTSWDSVEGERMYDKLRGLEPYYVKNALSSLGHSHLLPPGQLNFYWGKSGAEPFIAKSKHAFTYL